MCYRDRAPRQRGLVEPFALGRGTEVLLPGIDGQYAARGLSPLLGPLLSPAMRHMLVEKHTFPEYKTGNRREKAQIGANNFKLPRGN